MGFRANNLQNEAVLSISRSMMDGRKGRIAKKTIKCECSKCGEVSFIVESNRGSEHVSCLGMKLSPRAKAAGLRGKVKGTWETWIDPIVKRDMAMHAFIEAETPMLCAMGFLLKEACQEQLMRTLKEIEASKDQDTLNSIRAMTPGAEEIHLPTLRGELDDAIVRDVEGTREDT